MRFVTLLPLDGRKEVEEERSKARAGGVTSETQPSEGAAAPGPLLRQSYFLPAIKLPQLLGPFHFHCCFLLLVNLFWNNSRFIEKLQR